MQTVRRVVKRFELAERLRDDWKLLASLRWYYAHLVPGKWIELAPPRRERSRKLNSTWDDALKAARRLLGVVVRQTKDESGRQCWKYYVRRDVWELVQSRLGTRPQPLPGGQESYLYLSDEAASRLDSDREQREFEFELKLLSPSIKQRFKRLPVGFKMSPELEQLSAELAPDLLERTKAFLSRDYNRLGRPAVPTPILKGTPKLKPPKPPPSLNELYTQGLQKSVKSFMTRIRIDSQL